jgi:predicted ester cyclase
VIESIVADGDLVVTRVSVNKPIRFGEMHMYRLKDGKIVELWSQVDFLAILTQIGAVPPPKH